MSGFGSERDTVRLPAPPAPRASILILAWKNVGPLAHCLDSLQKFLPSDIAEVVILLNGARTEVIEYVKRHVVGAKVVDSAVNLGFAGGCNFAATAAAGEYLVLLNDDTEIRSGWLQALIETADTHPTAGAVGSRVLFPDGSLQEAGCIIWNDGSTMPIGRNSPPESTAFKYRRRVDYCSGCSLLIRRSVWDRLGGLDEGYFPAYYEDTDFSLAVRIEGGDVIYEPRSEVVHIESASSDDQFKEVLFAQSRRRFEHKWRSELTRFPHAEPTSAISVYRAMQRARGTHLRVLVIDDRVPDPASGSGFARMHQALEQLANERASVAFYASAEDRPDPAPLGRWGIDTLHERLDTHVARTEILYDAVLISRPHNYAKYANLVRRFQPQAALVYDAESLFWRRLARREALTGAPDHTAAPAQTLEREIARTADRVLCISPTEARWFRAAGAAHVQVLSPFWPDVQPGSADCSARRGILYVAGWLAGADSPNSDGLIWFVRDVLPRVRQSVPGLRLAVTGDIPESVRVSVGDTLEVLGRVPTVEPVYSRARVVIAPVRYGAGVKLKVIEALQHGVPVVTSAVGVEGIRLTVDGAVRTADRPTRFADHVSELLIDDMAWDTQRQSILTLVADWRRRHTPGAWAAEVARAIQERTPATVAARVREPQLIDNELVLPC